MTNNSHEMLMDLLKENDKDHADKIRSDNDRLFFLNNMRQRRRLPRVFTIEEAEAWYSSIQGGAA